eukprot:196984_1
MYANLHDTPQRMKDVGVIKQVVEWKKSRHFFYWRLRTKLIRIKSIKQIRTDLDDCEYEEAKATFDEFVKQKDDDDDKSFVEAFETQRMQFDQFRKGLQIQTMKRKLKQIVKQINQCGQDKKELKQMLDDLLLCGGGNATDDDDDEEQQQPHIEVVNID